MNNNTNNLNRDIPDKVLELISWYAIGNLSVEDNVIFEKALIEYPSLEILLKQELQMIEIVSAKESLLETSAIAPQEERLKSVLNIIASNDTQIQKNPSTASVSLSDKLKTAFGFLIPNFQGAPQYAPVASVGVLVLSVAVLTAFVAPLFTQTSEFVPASADVQPSNEQNPSLVNASNTTLLVGFNGTSEQLGNNDVLKGKILKIETVPNKEGIYQISFNQVLSSSEIKQTIDALLKQKELIWFAGEEF